MSRIAFPIFYLFSILLSSLGQPLPNTLDHCAANSPIDIQETVIDSAVQQIEWLKSEVNGKRFIFVRSLNGILYKSEDEGRNWNQENLKLRESKGIPGAKVEIINILRTSDDDKLWFIGKGNDTWVTEDRGQSYSFRNHHLELFDFKIHPERSTWALARNYSRSICKSYQIGRCYQNLLLTKDFGITWQVIQEYAGNSYWGIGDRIWAELFPKIGNQNPYNDYDTSLFSSPDAGKTWNNVIDHVAGFMIKFDSLFVVTFSENENGLTVWTARKKGNLPLKQAKLPTKLEEQRYTILDMTNDFIFLSVQHDNTAWGNIYISDKDENNYVLSLPMNSRDAAGHVDFTKVKNVNGVYIANVYKDKFLLETRDQQTLITWNNGGNWVPIDPPIVDCNGNPIVCRGCTLNLYGDHKQTENGNPDLGDYGPLHSKANALGLLAATGNVGKYLDVSQVNTYFSRDAGATWKEVRKGSHIYEFGDHGAITIMARTKIFTDTILYTYDFGSNWTECKFTSDKYQINDIVAEPNNTGVDFLVLGWKQDYVTKKEVGVLVYIGFSNIHLKKCEDQDYEYWSPGEKTCILGEKIMYQRRKENIMCYNSKDFEANRTTGSCKCSIEDYECDYCFEPYSGDGTRCIPICDDETIAKPPADCKDYYNVSRGYRLVEGDKCQDGLDLKPQKVSCPSSTKQTSPPSQNQGLSTKAIALIVFFTLVGIFMMIGGCIVLSVTNKRFRNILNISGRLPSTIRDPFKGTSFIRIDNVDDDGL